VFFTQLIGLAFGLSEKELGLQRGFTRLRKPSPVPAQPAAA
jgi:heterodisulfide reductase subunit B